MEQISDGIIISQCRTTESTHCLYTFCSTQSGVDVGTSCVNLSFYIINTNTQCSVSSVGVQFVLIHIGLYSSDAVGQCGTQVSIVTKGGSDLIECVKGTRCVVNQVSNGSLHISSCSQLSCGSSSSGCRCLRSACKNRRIKRSQESLSSQCSGFLSVNISNSSSCLSSQGVVDGSLVGIYVILDNLLSSQGSSSLSSNGVVSILLILIHISLYSCNSSISVCFILIYISLHSSNCCGCSWISFQNQKSGIQSCISSVCISFVLINISLHSCDSSVGVSFILIHVSLNGCFCSCGARCLSVDQIGVSLTCCFSISEVVGIIIEGCSQLIECIQGARCTVNQSRDLGVNVSSSSFVGQIQRRCALIINKKTLVTSQASIKSTSNRCPAAISKSSICFCLSGKEAIDIVVIITSTLQCQIRSGKLC